MTCFQGFDALQTDDERRHYLEYRLQKIRDAFREEFLARVPRRGFH